MFGDQSFPKGIGGGPAPSSCREAPQAPESSGSAEWSRDLCPRGGRGGTAAAGLGPGVRTSENWRPTSESGSLSPGPCDCDVTGALDGPERELAGQ